MIYNYKLYCILFQAERLQIPGARSFFHYVARQELSEPRDVLASHDGVPAFFKKRARCYRGPDADTARRRALQFAADRGAYALALPVGADKEPVEISGAVDISEADYLASVDGDDAPVGEQALVPCGEIPPARGPGVELGGSVVGGAHGVHGVVKKLGRLATVAAAVFSDDYGSILLKKIKITRHADDLPDGMIKILYHRFAAGGYFSRELAQHVHL